LISIIGIVIASFEIKWLGFIINEIVSQNEVSLIVGKLYRYSQRQDSKIFGLGSIVNLLILYYILWKRDKFENSKMFNIFLNLFLLNIFFYYFTWELNEISSRIRLYFASGSVLLFPCFLDVYRNKIRKLAVLTFIILYSLYFGRIYIFQFREAIAYNPYQNYLIYQAFGKKSTGAERNREFNGIQKK
jgi:hypothetical protein